MILNKNLRKILLVIFSALVISACSTAKKSGNIEEEMFTLDPKQLSI